MNIHLGTFILALIGIGAGLRSGDLSPLGGAIAGGLGVCLGIFTAANVSGGHVNPAVTTAFWIQGRLGSNFISNTLMMLIYFAAQEHVLLYRTFDMAHRNGLIKNQALEQN